MRISASLSEAPANNQFSFSSGLRLTEANYVAPDHRAASHDVYESAPRSSSDWSPLRQQDVLWTLY